MSLEFTMKKLVPDPPTFPIPYISIIADLSHAEARSQAAKLMGSLSQTIELYLKAEDSLQHSALLENMSALTELLHALFAHIKAQEAVE